MSFASRMRVTRVAFLIHTSLAAESLEAQALVWPSVYRFSYPIMANSAPISLRNFRAFAAANPRLASPTGAAVFSSLRDATSAVWCHADSTPIRRTDKWCAQTRKKHCVLSTHASNRSMATLAADIAREQDNAEVPAVGRFVHFKRKDGSLALGVILRISNRGPNCWDIEDVKGAVHAVKARDITYVIPLSASPQARQGSTLVDLVAFDQDARRRHADAIAEDIIKLAWDVSEERALYSVAEMAQLLFGDATPTSCATAHLLLHDSKLYFKLIGRTPPMFAARNPAEVDFLRRRNEAQKAAETQRNAFLAAVEQARSLPPSQRPNAQAWQCGSHAASVAALEAFALGWTMPRIPSPNPYASSSTSSSSDNGDNDGVGGGAEQSARAAAAEPTESRVVVAVDILAAAGRPRTPQAAMDLLRDSGFWPPHAQLSLLAAGLAGERFPEELESFAARLVDRPPPDPDARHRVKLTDLEVLTIDDAETMEVDDGLSAEPVPGGGVRVWVHVADPSRWIVPGFELDKEARRRTKTLYLPTGMVPMFPLSLATGPFSLRQGVEGPALSVCCVLTEDGEILPGSVQVTPSTITPTRRLTYDLADEMLLECSAEEEPGLHALATAAAARRNRRLAAGALEISLPEARVAVADPLEENPEVALELRTEAGESASHGLVAEMMILAGEVCARLGSSMGLALPYRGQEQPILPSEEELLAAPPGPARSMLLRSCMTRSVTVADAPKRHAGLGLDAYVQVTSPIRRYPDLLAHWQLKAALRGEVPPFTAPELASILADVGTASQEMTKLERESQSYWVAHYFRNAVAMDADATWQATFLSWFKQEAGLGRALLIDVGLEVMVKIARPVTPGSNLIVRCVAADPASRTLRLDEVVGGAVFGCNENSRAAVAG